MFAVGSSLLGVKVLHRSFFSHCCFCRCRAMLGSGTGSMVRYGRNVTCIQYGRRFVADGLIFFWLKLCLQCLHKCPQLNKLGCHFLTCCTSFVGDERRESSMSCERYIELKMRCDAMTQPAITLIICLHIISLHLQKKKWGENTSSSTSFPFFLHNDLQTMVWLEFCFGSFNIWFEIILNDWRFLAHVWIFSFRIMK